jgi:hypothetical protein
VHYSLLHILRSSFPNRALTTRRLGSGLETLDALLDGGLVRGRISEIIGPIGSGRTTIAACFVSAATRAGEIIAWIESTHNFDPAAIAAGSASLERILWASVDDRRQLFSESAARLHRDRPATVAQAAELVLKAGGFGLIVIDFGASAAPLPQSIALRLAREAERSGAVVIVIAPHQVCGAFAALSLKLMRIEASFNRPAAASPWLFDGLVIQASAVRNKLGRMGTSAMVWAAIEPLALGARPRRELMRRENHVLSASDRLDASRI